MAISIENPSCKLTRWGMVCSAGDYLQACLKTEPILAAAAAEAAAAADAQAAALAKVHRASTLHSAQRSFISSQC